MLKMSAFVWLMAAVAFTAFPPFGLQAWADQSVKLPPNATVKIEGNSALINDGGGGGPGESGTFTCGCVAGSGSCKMTRTGNAIVCTNNDGATCKGSCEIQTTTTGVAGAKAGSQPLRVAPSQSK